jgi:multidrug efflux system membrane fusion protein
MPENMTDTSTEVTSVSRPEGRGSDPIFNEPSHEPKHRGWVWALLLIALAVGGLLYYQHRSSADDSKAKAAPAPRAVPVTTSPAKKGDIGVYVEALGTVTPVYTVTVTSRVQGQIMNVYYKEGQMARKGAPLLDIDPRPYQAALMQSEGQLAHDQAQLNQSRIDLDRYKSAFSRNAIAQQQVYDQEQAVQQYQGTVKNDEGVVENAKINLSYTHITAPIDGRVGLRLVDPGNIVQANSATPLVVVTQLQPITVIFSIAEDYLPQIQKQLSQGHTMAVDALDRTQETQIATGSLLTLDNQIDTSTGTVKLKAIFPNKDSALFPNQFVNTRLLVETQHNATLLPAAAIQRSAQGAFVYVVKPDNTAQLRNIKAGVADGNTQAVQGVQPNEMVAVSGFDRLQDGAKVAVRAGRRGNGGGNGNGNASGDDAP